MGAGFDVDVASTTISIAESSLLPNVSVQGNASRSSDTDRRWAPAGPIRPPSSAMQVPIYDGGTAASQTRQAKELTMQSRHVLEQVRGQAQTAVIGAWVTNEGAKIAVAASESEVRAATSR